MLHDTKCINIITFFTLSNYVDTERIDILINNAGIVFHPFEKTTEGFEMHFVTNYLGNYGKHSMVG
jgi:NAD(P)-dependent dehydrogenase (short-subunit alcohol dehydrogenase family)